MRVPLREHVRKDGQAKVAYPSLLVARQEANRRHMKAYQCSLCGQFHLGHHVR